MNGMVELTEVSKSYAARANLDRPALDGVSLTVSGGEFVAILGPSGSGKSTLLNMMAGLDAPTRGSVTVDGVNLTRLGEARLARFRRARIGFIFQFFNLLNDMSVLDNVRLPALLVHRRLETAKGQAMQLLNRLGIADKAGQRPLKLSGGEQQRVAIARALINQPRILLADEPTGTLDSENARQVMELLVELHREGQTIVLVTHDPRLAHRYATRALSLLDGCLTTDFDGYFGGARPEGVA